MLQNTIVIALLLVSLANGLQVFGANSTPTWLLGAWRGTQMRGPGPDNKYEIYVSFSDNRYMYRIRGGPDDHANNISCGMAWLSTYDITRRGAFTVTVQLNIPKVEDVRKSSNYCKDNFFKAGLVPPPQSLVIELEDLQEPSKATFNKVPYIKKGEPPVMSQMEVDRFIRGLPSRQH